MFRAIDRWLLPYLLRPRFRSRVTDVFIAVCDHYEPFHHADKQIAVARVRRWRSEWRRFTDTFRDSDGTPPRHSFFYPIEQYDREVIEELAGVCRDTGGEVEIHLHHDRDNADNLRRTLEQGKRDLAAHGLLSKAPDGSLAYGFVHGNWALDDSDPHGRGCGVRGELAILKQSGCYADFTMPSAPHPAQARKVNEIYWSQSTMHGASHNHGIRLDTRAPQIEKRTKEDWLLMVQGPLGLDWGRKKIENAEVAGNNPPVIERMKVWTHLAPSLAGADSFRFIKLHTHGAIEKNADVLLGHVNWRFHEELALWAEQQRVRVHYVTAREMTNAILALEDGKDLGTYPSWRDHMFKLAK